MDELMGRCAAVVGKEGHVVAVENRRRLGGRFTGRTNGRHRGRGSRGRSTDVFERAGRRVFAFARQVIQVLKPL